MPMKVCTITGDEFTLTCDAERLLAKNENENSKVTLLAVIPSYLPGLLVEAFLSPSPNECYEDVVIFTLQSEDGCVLSGRLGITATKQDYHVVLGVIGGEDNTRVEAQKQLVWEFQEKLYRQFFQQVCKHLDLLSGPMCYCKETGETIVFCKDHVSRYYQRCDLVDPLSPMIKKEGDFFPSMLIGSCFSASICKMQYTMLDPSIRCYPFCLLSGRKWKSQDPRDPKQDTQEVSEEWVLHRIRVESPFVTAFLMGKHKRLGAGSWVIELERAQITKILEHVFPRSCFVCI